MKRLFTFLVFSLLTFSALKSQIIISDDLSIRNLAQLSGQGSWTNSSSGVGGGTCAGAGCTNIPVVTSTLSYPGYSGGSGKAASMSLAYDNVGLPFTPTSGTIYFAFVINFSSASTSAQPTSTFGTVLGDFFRFGTGTGVSGFAGRVYASDRTVAGYKLSISKTGSGVANYAQTTNRYSLNANHLIIVKYEIKTGGTTDDVISLYVDPVTSIVEPSPTITITNGTDGGGTAISSLSRFVLYSGGSSSSSPTGQSGLFNVSSSWAALFPTCQSPSSLVASSILPNSATITWSGNGSNVGGYEYELSTGVFTGVNTTTTSTSIPLTGLTPGTLYNFRVRTNCTGADGNSAYTSTTFTTAPTCITPTTLSTSNVTSNSVQIGFTQPAGSLSPPMAWEYQLSSTSTFATLLGSGSFNTNPGLVTGLSPSIFYYYRIRSACGGVGGMDNSAWSDYAFFTSGASCIAPISPTHSSVTATQATIGWTQPTGSLSNPTNWDIEYATNSAFTGSTVIPVTTNPFTLTGLNNSTTYFYRTRANCGTGDVSLYSTFNSFSTPCPSINISITPYTEGFEAPTASGSLPNCWSKSVIGTGSANAIASSSFSFPNGTPFAGLQVLRFQYTASIQRVVLPTFDASGLPTVEVSFYASEDNGASAFNDNIKVQYSLDGSSWIDVSTPVVRYNVSAISSATWTKRSFILPSAAISTNLQVALYHTGTGTNGNTMYIDDIKVGAGTSIQDANTNTCNTATTTTAIAGSVISGKNWFRYTDGGNIVAEINPNGNNLGATTIKVIEQATGAANVPTLNNQAFLSRLFSIKPATAPSSAVGVRLYFSDQEFLDYVAKTSSIATLGGLSLKKISGIVEDCDFTNNTGGTVTMITPTAVDYGSGFYLEFTTTSFSEFSALDINVVLAVELKDIQANATGKSNKVSWTTASEKNNAHFVIERSATGENGWANIGKVKSFGNTNAETNYSFNDNDPLSISYYRLRSVDNNGKEEVSKVVSVYRKTGKLNIAKVSPVPSSDFITLDVESLNEANGLVTISDITGRVVSTQKVSLKEGFSQLTLSLNNIVNGTYILSLTNQEAVSTYRIVKQ
jgi:Secretion system C-terminal sorting domain/Fibronectin type III domain